MRPALFAPLLLAAAMLTAADSKDPLAGYVAGKPVRCIDYHFSDGPSIIDEHTILYRESGRRIWKTGPVDRCPSLRPLNTLVVEIRGGQLCDTDRFRVIAPGDIIPGPYCRFDKFTPYTKPAK